VAPKQRKETDVSIENVIKDAVKEGFKEALEELRSAPTAANAAEAKESLVDVQEAARRLGLAVSTVYQRAAALKLPSVKDGSRLLFRPADLDAYIAKQRRSWSLAQRLARGSNKTRANELSTTDAVRRGKHNALHNAANDDRPEARELGDSPHSR
jgi:excisionase family DNA binding protein